MLSADSHLPSCHNRPVTCAICEKRKEKRFCPAVHGSICPQCCGEQREVTLDCPSSCVYLQQARQYERPRSMEELDPSLLFAEVEVPERFLYEHEPLILGFLYALAKSGQRDHALTDDDLLAALTSMAKSYERLVNSGLHYENPMTSVPRQAVVKELQESIAGYCETEQKNMGYSRLRDSEILQTLVFLVRMG